MWTQRRCSAEILPIRSLPFSRLSSKPNKPHGAIHFAPCGLLFSSKIIWPCDGSKSGGAEDDHIIRHAGTMVEWARGRYSGQVAQSS